MGLQHAHIRTWFPLIVAGLTIALLVLVGWWFSLRIFFPPLSKPQEKNQRTAPTTEMYETSVSGILSNFLDELDAATDNTWRLTLVEETENHMLALLVPAERRDVHLEIITSLHLMRTGFSKNTPDTVEEGRHRLEEIFVRESWLP
ncbi:MAG: hypothetical protein UU48_C0002G0146 [Candidatus Uhrbacteria bacterium GW2011_GWF2_41_16]|jgi:hypothetical protein|uniref:Uncharacterized protein n=2 Tax=Candidatus Uhriibacteriota TaxID=1752732 RepID=A0A0G0VG61_9BACT|nr:MAG: hypothetical protein UU31_C0003G0155 [Candidatus Uhrbacteria bacterium GW2011_GWA2_41_10]KKR87632.1 MAG: hypothetical protein UU35_C0002G0133 [Candidatus Uhrbacteria bacterium GW2011_GWC2_41_11]KKR98611.1 MAG: hypothetical protein UU48_C0002G0146 [Candidatus Uhrbacteria bacterium GW2011_GWF2_41_16]HBP00478.1 hypothetical protein [Candidatus Uhrbacteria bacterium]